ncbi:coiled-coil domain-containing protein 102B-like [Labeo rohita]|uniref:Coiled-coil domain-containing protein 102B-like n=1 Tax=Labeo rohita TaxID=84645 RepID=A0A498M0Y1_LABRO|nr:coiled-coil domain-containing protein 102B-like [Labeo rohita]
MKRLENRGALMIGGNRELVEIDESKFRHKRKYNRGRFPGSNNRPSWVFGMLGVRGKSRRPILKLVKRRSRLQLLPHVEKHVKRGTTISDEVFTSLVCLDTLRPTHPSPHFTSGSQSLTQHLVVPPHIGFYTPQICVSPSSPQRANMPQTADPIAQGEDVNTWLRGMTESLTPKTCELLLFLIIILILRRLLTHDSSQNNNHEELVKITSSLSYAFTAQLHLSDKHITHLQEELTRAQSRIDKLEVKVQDQLKAPNEREQETMEQVKKLQAALGAAQCDQQQANAAQKDLVILTCP